MAAMRRATPPMTMPAMEPTGIEELFDDPLFVVPPDAPFAVGPVVPVDLTVVPAVSTGVSRVGFAAPLDVGSLVLATLVAMRLAGSPSAERSHRPV
jgi:hypothetical protein